MAWNIIVDWFLRIIRVAAALTVIGFLFATIGGLRAAALIILVAGISVGVQLWYNRR